MRSKTSLFNGAVFRSNLVRFWPVWCAYLIIILLLVPAPLLSAMKGARDMNAHSAGYLLMTEGAYACAVLNIVFGAISAMAVFSYMYSPRSVGMAASLPIRREGMFLTCWLSGLLWLLVPAVLAGAVSGVITACAGVFSARYILWWLAVCAMQAVFFYGLASLCAVLTGALYVLPAVYAIFNFLAVAVEHLVRQALDILVFGISLDGPLRLRFLSPICEMFRMTSTRIVDETGGVTGVACNGMMTMVYYLAAGLILSALALFVYRRRRMEAASDVVAVPALKPVFRYCLAVGFALTLGLAIYHLALAPLGTPLLSVMLCMLIAGFMGYFAAEMLMRKSFRVFDKWRGYAVLGLVVIALLLAVDLDAFGYERRIPDTSETKGATVQYSGAGFIAEDAGDIDAIRALHKSILEKHGEFADGEQVSSARLIIEYLLKDGRTVSREYFPGGDSLGLLDAVINSPGAILQRSSVPFDVTPDTVSYASIDGASETGDYVRIELSGEQAAEFYNECLLPDMQDGLIGREELLSYSCGAALNGVTERYAADISMNDYGCSVRIEFVIRDGEGSYSDYGVYQEITPEAYRCAAYARALGIRLGG